MPKNEQLRCNRQIIQQEIITINNNKKPENLNKPVIIQKKMNLQTENLYSDTMPPQQTLISSVLAGELNQLYRKPILSNSHKTLQQVEKEGAVPSFTLPTTCYRKVVSQYPMESKLQGQEDGSANKDSWRQA